jgi:molybdate transport system substrate-binding protein
MRPATRLLVGALGLLAGRAGLAADTLVAVAASFLPPMEIVSAQFEVHTGHVVTLASGSTGALYAQIVNGAPFDLFIAAEQERPRLLEASGLGVATTRTTVARGRLVLFSRDAALIDTYGLEALERPSLRHVAIANPQLAPYGVAARETLMALGLWQHLLPRLVRGESVAQTFAMIATGNAELGFVALAQVATDDRNGAYVLIPETLHTPLYHDMIVLERAQNNPATQALHAYLSSPSATETIRRFGYATTN